MDFTNKLAKEGSRDEVLETLRVAAHELITFYLSVSCPCAFPRFRFLIGFDGNEYTKSLLHTFETNVCTDASLKYDPAFLIKDEKDHAMFSCRICGTRYEYIYEQYGIAFELARLVPKDIKASQQGADVEFPFPLFASFYVADGARSEDDVQKDMSILGEKFPRVTLDEFMDYMLALRK